MARPKVWLMRNYHDPKIEAFLSKHFEVIVRQSNVTPPHEEVVRMAAECDGFLPEGIDPIDAEVLDNASRLKIISDRSVGTDNVDIPAATRNGVLLTNTPGILPGRLRGHDLCTAAELRPSGDALRQRHQGRQVDRI